MRHQGAGQLLGTRARIGSRRSAGVERRLSRLGGAHRNRRRRSSCWQPARAACCNRRCLSAWLVVAAAIAWNYFQRNRDWTDVRLNMTHDLVESMAGHRTRLAQLAPDRWHDGEDEALEEYLKSSRRHGSVHRATDRDWCRAAGWFLGLLGLTPAFVHGSAIAGTHRDRRGRHLARLSRLEAAGRRAPGSWPAPPWHGSEHRFCSTRRERHGITRSAGCRRSDEDAPLVVEARGLDFRYNEPRRTRAARRNARNRARRSGGAGRRFGRRKIHPGFAAGRRARAQFRPHSDAWIRSPNARRRRMAQAPGRRPAVP